MRKVSGTKWLTWKAQSLIRPRNSEQLLSERSTPSCGNKPPWDREGPDEAEYAGLGEEATAKVGRIGRQVSAFHRDESGVTLVELLVVIGILAFLAAVVVPNFTGLIFSGRTEANKAELTTVQTIVDVYMTEKRKTLLAGAELSIAPADYSTGPYAAYFRTTPECTYVVGADGAVPVANQTCP